MFQLVRLATLLIFLLYFQAAASAPVAAEVAKQGQKGIAVMKRDGGEERVWMRGPTLENVVPLSMLPNGWN